MNNEQMRVRARMLLVGKSYTGRGLLIFNVIMRLLLRVLVALLLWKLASLAHGVGGRVIIAFSFMSILLAELLCECVSVVRDRWYLALCSEKPVTVLKLMIEFNIQDFVLALKSGIAVRLASALRIFVFLAFPLFFNVFSLAVAKRGASAAVLSVLGVGSLLLLLCGMIFSAVSIGCVNLARILCCYDIKKFSSALKRLEASASALFKYSLLLGLFNSAYRRTAKLIFALGICDINS